MLSASTSISCSVRFPGHIGEQLLIDLPRNSIPGWREQCAAAAGSYVLLSLQLGTTAFLSKYRLAF